MIHLGESTKIYKCDLCPYKARYRQALKVHYRFHSGIRPYSCDFCSKTFVTSQTRKLHMVLVHKGFASKIYSCDQCSYKTPYNPHLKSHVKKVHLGVKDVRHKTCPYCSKVYTNSGSLISHKRKKHPRQLQKELLAKQERKVQFMKACAAKVHSGAGGDVALETLCKASGSKEYLDDIQAYLKTKMDKVSEEYYAGEQKNQSAVTVALDNLNALDAAMSPRVELERISLPSNSVKVAEHDRESQPMWKPSRTKNKASESPKKQSKRLPHIVLKLPRARKASNKKAKSVKKGAEKAQSVAATGAEASPKKKEKATLTPPQVVYENAADSVFSVPICSGSLHGQYQVIGTVVSPTLPGTWMHGQVTPKGGSSGSCGSKVQVQFAGRPMTREKEFESLRALAASYVSRDPKDGDGNADVSENYSLSLVTHIKTETVSVEDEPQSVVPMSLITHTDALQRGPYTMEAVESSGERGPVGAKIKVEVQEETQFTIQNEPE